MPKPREPLRVIDDLGDIPPFHDEAEEAAFWETHRMSDELLERMQPMGVDVAPPARATKSITLRIDPVLLERIQVLARQRRMPYQSLLKRFLEERLQQVEAGDRDGAPVRSSTDPETVRQTARSIAKLARELETAVASLT